MSLVAAAVFTACGSSHGVDGTDAAALEDGGGVEAEAGTVQAGAQAPPVTPVGVDAGELDAGSDAGRSDGGTRLDAAMQGDTGVPDAGDAPRDAGVDAAAAADAGRDAASGGGDDGGGTDEDGGIDDGPPAACVLESCPVGLHDLDGDGSCEYHCLEVADDDVVCDLRDGDCDGDIDEDVDTDSDPDNCGGCGFGCRFPHVVGSTCNGGVCDFDAGSCQDGFRNADGVEANGCEQACAVVPPVDELCNLVDDDCDGEVDEGTELTDPLIGAACGDDTGACQAGVTVCFSGFGTCVGAVTSTTELCNGEDDDCDGMTDESDPRLGTACGNGIGSCAQGSRQCTGGALVCADGVDPVPETCNGEDDDCDGTIDEGCTSCTAESCNDLDDDCDGNVDEEEVCGAGCVQEVCNGEDDDCDGTADEDVQGDPQLGLPCGETRGECDGGVTICNGGVTCSAMGGSSEVCNGLDDDCDGVVDDGIPVGEACGTDVGACRHGYFACDASGLVCVGGHGPSDEVCNGLDDDCDGQTDEGVAPSECGSALGECERGQTQCVGGALRCVGEIAPAPELCNCLDDDCDGFVDEEGGPGCPAGSVCLDCACVTECTAVTGCDTACPAGTRAEQTGDACVCR